MRDQQSPKGIVFEKWVAQLYDELGKLQVQHDLRLRKRGAMSQIDIRYGLLEKHYVECKYHDDPQKKVVFSEVAKFVSVLDLHGIGPGQGIVVTNTGYDHRTRVYARKVNLTLIDRLGLVRLDWQRSHQLRSLVSSPPKGFGEDLENRIASYR